MRRHVLMLVPRRGTGAETGLGSLDGRVNGTSGHSA